MKNNFFYIVEPLLKEYEAEYRSISVDGFTYTVFALPYVQLELPDESHAFIDSYYIASNKAYFLRKKINEKLKEKGFEVADCALSYKSLAVASGLGIPLRSTLVANERFGTRMALEIVCVKGTFAEVKELDLINQKPVLTKICANCGICQRLCPQHCFEGESFAREKCTRQHQENASFPDENSAQAAGTQLWGCDICQRCCPFNKSQPTRPMTEEEKELFEINNLFTAFLSGKKGCEPYRDILGGNYLRPAKLTALVLNVMANSKNPSLYADCAEKTKDHADERVRTASQRLANKITLTKT